MNACEKGHTLILFKDGENCPVCDGAKKYEELTEKYWNLVDQNIELKEGIEQFKESSSLLLLQYNKDNNKLIKALDDLKNLRNCDNCSLDPLPIKKNLRCMFCKRNKNIKVEENFQDNWKGGKT